MTKRYDHGGRLGALAAMDVYALISVPIDSVSQLIPTDITATEPDVTYC